MSEHMRTRDPRNIPTFSLSKIKLFHPHEIDTVYTEYIKGAKICADAKKTYYYNIPCAFDIETTSFYRDDNGKKSKGAIMYAWALGLNGAVILGRTWQEFLICYERLCELCRTHEKMRLRIYVHNMAFDFQFFRKWLAWKRVFAIDERKVLDVETVDGIEFRCSYLLSGYSLEALGKELQKYKVEKASGDLDYSLIRHSKTPLSKTETGYIVCDVLVVMAYIQERIELDGNITKIPLTKTGYVRKYCKNMCFYGEEKENRKKTYYQYRDTMRALTLQPTEYQQLKRVFAGGFTHANALYSGLTLNNVGSADLTSSYPTVMISEKFPMSKGTPEIITSTAQFDNLISKYCCIFDVYIEGLSPKIYSENPLSFSKCWNVVKPVINNGRIAYADALYTSVTETDFANLCRFYTWDKIKIGNFIKYHKSYLPTNFVRAILKLYKDKTELKDVLGREFDYLLSKGMLNSAFGMAVTDIVRDEYIYTDDWDETRKPDLTEMIEKYNRNKGRFLFYPWGVWITSYARRNLFTAIYEFGDDHVYSDTDSEKGVNFSAHMPYFDGYNNWITERLERALKWHGIDYSAIRPKTIKGDEKPLGIWEIEHEIKKFKTLGAKRYMTYSDNILSITVSGVNKQYAVPYILDVCKIPYKIDEYKRCVILDDTHIERAFNMFDDDLKIPADFTGKNTHTYIDAPIQGVLQDYRGEYAEYNERSGVHLEKAEYNLSLSKMYIDYMLGIRSKNK